MGIEKAPESKSVVSRAAGVMGQSKRILRLVMHPDPPTLMAY